MQCGQARPGSRVREAEGSMTGAGERLRPRRDTVLILFIMPTHWHCTRGQQADSTSGSWLAITHHPEPAKLARPGGEIIFFARRCLLLTVSRIFWLQIEVQPMAQSGSFRQQSACAAQARSEPQPLVEAMYHPSW